MPRLEILDRAKARIEQAIGDALTPTPNGLCWRYDTAFFAIGEAQAMLADMLNNPDDYTPEQIAAQKIAVQDLITANAVDADKVRIQNNEIMHEVLRMFTGTELLTTESFPSD